MKKSRLVPMLKARGVNLYDLIDTGVTIAYLGLIDNGAGKMSHRLADNVDSLLGREKGTFFAEFEAENDS
jgi:hypothetical protein